MIDPTADPLLVGLQITITGISIVFIVLTIVAITLSALNASQRLFRPKPMAPTTPPQPPATADQLDPQLIAVLTAAAVVTLQHPVRVLRVRYYRQPSGMWTRLGRVSVMASRQLRR